MKIIMISIIVFDLGNVLLPFSYTKPIEEFNQLKPGLGNKFAELYKENYHVHRSFESGAISRKEFLSIMLSWLDNIISEEEFCRAYSNIFTLNENVIELLPKLKKEYNLCLLSNTNEIHEEYGYIHLPFFKNFDRLFLSHKVGAVKPEEKIYRTVEDFTKKPSNEHLFIDDILEYVEGAKKCGWDGIQFTNYEKLVSDFRSRGVAI